MIQELPLHVVSAKVVHGVACLLFLFVCFITTTKAMTKDIRHSLTTLESAAFSKGIVSIFLENSESICSFKQLKKQMTSKILKEFKNSKAADVTYYRKLPAHHS